MPIAVIQAAVNECSCAAVSPIALGGDLPTFDARHLHAMPDSQALLTDDPGHRPNQRCRLCAARRICQVGQLPSDHLARLDPLIVEVDVAKGEPLQTQDAHQEVLRAIKLGTVMISRRGPDRADRPVALLGRGHWLDHGGLLGHPSASSARALSPGRLCEIPWSALRGDDRTEAVMQGALLAALAHTWGRVADWGQVMRMRGLRRQLVNTLLLLSEEQGSQTVRLPTHVALAELLGTSRESVARTLQSLAQDGYLRRVDRWHAELASSHTALFRDPSSEDR